MNDDVTLTIDDRAYINPQTGLDEANVFIDTLRDVQGQNTAQINQTFSNLGSQVPSNIGGLAGSEGLWEAQYQLPQTQAQVANLRATAQQTALNQAMQNLSDVYQNRYKQALRGYYARKKAEEDAAKNPATPDTTKDNLNLTTSDIEAGLVQSGAAPAGWAYVRNPLGGDRWYKLNEDGSIDYENYVDVNPYTGTRTSDYVGGGLFNQQKYEGTTRY